jgi:L-amino acid N-acyltransferase YncA
MSSLGSIQVRPARAEDAAAIASIYNHYIETSIATFEEEAVAAEDMQGRLARVSDAGYAWLVAEGETGLLGYAYSGQWNPRSAYRYSVETTVYVVSGAGAMGVGTLLYSELFSLLRAANYRVAMAGISLPNDASVALHEKFGMEKVAHFKEVGYKFGRWIDVGYWQVSLR